MDKELILEKFGGEYIVNDDTFIMGIHYRLANTIVRPFVKCRRVLDACTGSGFLAIALAKHTRVVAVDINPMHLAMAQENAKIAGVSANIEFVLGDSSSDTLVNSIGEIDGAILDMDWSMTSDKRAHVSSLSQMIPPGDLLIEKISPLTWNIGLRLPKEYNLNELKKFPKHRIEEIKMDGKLKFYMAYFGNL